jgi:hypothetical protein
LPVRPGPLSRVCIRPTKKPPTGALRVWRLSFCQEAPLRRVI